MKKKNPEIPALTCHSSQGTCYKREVKRHVFLRFSAAKFIVLCNEVKNRRRAGRKNRIESSVCPYKNLTSPYFL